MPKTKAQYNPNAFVRPDVFKRIRAKEKKGQIPCIADIFIDRTEGVGIMAKLWSLYHETDMDQVDMEFVDDYYNPSAVDAWDNEDADDVVQAILDIIHEMDEYMYKMPF